MWQLILSDHGTVEENFNRYCCGLCFACPLGQALEVQYVLHN